MINGMPYLNIWFFEWSSLMYTIKSINFYYDTMYVSTYLWAYFFGLVRNQTDARVRAARIIRSNASPNAKDWESEITPNGCF